jgi:uncharacterized membrane protein (UPF0127 family)
MWLRSTPMETEEASARPGRSAGAPPASIERSDRGPDDLPVGPAVPSRRAVARKSRSAEARPVARPLKTVTLTTTDRRIVCSQCEVAERTLARMKGLLGRTGLGPGKGMLITPAPSVMTFFMRFPIDVVFLDRDWRVVKVVHRLRPWRVAGARHAIAALELPAGTAEACSLQVGDVLELPPLDA